MTTPDSIDYDGQKKKNNNTNNTNNMNNMNNKNKNSNINNSSNNEMLTNLFEDILHRHDDGVLPRHDAIMHSAVAPLPDAVAALQNDA